MNRIARLVTAFFMLAGLFVYANHTGIAADFLAVAGVPEEKIPFIVSTAERADTLKREAAKKVIEKARETAAARKAAAAARQKAAAAKATVAASTARPGKTAKAEYAKALTSAKHLTVKGRAPKTGYSRDEFGSGWSTVKGCDTRNRILARDLTTVTFGDSKKCVVETGVLDPEAYTGKRINFVRGTKTSTAVQIDHMVALSDAWQKGAQGWSAATRKAFANDPANLLSTDGPANMGKGDGDTATWLPKNKAFRCEYVSRQVHIKDKYKAWVTKAEQDAMVRILAGC